MINQPALTPEAAHTLCVLRWKTVEQDGWRYDLRRGNYSGCYDVVATDGYCEWTAKDHGHSVSIWLITRSTTDNI